MVGDPGKWVCEVVTDYTPRDIEHKWHRDEERQYLWLTISGWIGPSQYSVRRCLPMKHEENSFAVDFTVNHAVAEFFAGVDNVIREHQAKGHEQS